MTFTEFIEIAGISAFAISGTLVAIRARLDLFGIFVLALITATGGGLFRDVILNKGIPIIFTHPIYLITITVSYIITCLSIRHIEKIQFIVTLFDAAGLGLFTVLTTYNCIKLNYPLFGIVFIACLTGIGGSILRDIMVNEVPLVFKSEIYAMAGIFGSLLFYFLYDKIDTDINLFLSALLVFSIRIVSVLLKINVPSVKLHDDSTQETSEDKNL